MTFVIVYMCTAHGLQSTFVHLSFDSPFLLKLICSGLMSLVPKHSGGWRIITNYLHYYCRLQCQ